MRKIESFMVGLFLGAIPVLFCFLIACLIHIVLFEEKAIPMWVLSGPGVGILIDAVFLKRWIKKAYQLSNKVLAAIYIFYSVGVLGFCMGVPILNFGVGVIAGIYTARKLYYIKPGKEVCVQSIKKTAVFSAAVMMAMCCLTGSWALVGGMVGARFESSVLSFTFTVPIIVGMVLTGGLLLCLLQYWLTSKAAKITLKSCGDSSLEFDVKDAGE